MILDQQQSYVAGDAMVFPDWIFGSMPKQPGEIREVVILTGTQAGSTPGISANVDDVE